MMCEERTAVSLFWGGRLFCVWRISSHREQKQRASRPVPENTTRKNKSAQHPTSKTQAYSKQIGTAPHIQNPNIQTQVNTLPFFTTKNSLKKARGVCRGAAALRPLCGFSFYTKKQLPHRKDVRAKFNGWRRIRTFEGGANRFTVCPLWPLGNPTKCLPDN